MTTKAEFFARPKIRRLPAAEKERRWQQHVMSIRASARVPQRDLARLNRRGYTRGTQLITTGMKAEVHLSPCAKHYLNALTIPFQNKGVACVPDFHAIPSKKIRVKTRGFFSTGLDGNGYIVAAAWCTSNVCPTIISSTATLASSTGVLLRGSVNTATFTINKIPYSNTQFEANGSNPGVQARRVSQCLRIRYLGPKLSQSGQIVGLRHPDNETLERRS